VAQPLQAQQGSGTQLSLFGQLGEQAGELGLALGRRLPSGVQFKARSAKGGVTANDPVPPGFASAEVARFTNGEAEQQPQQIVAARQIREPSLSLHFPTETEEGIDGDILGTAYPACCTAQPSLGDADHRLEIVLPEYLHSLLFSTLQGRDYACN